MMTSLFDSERNKGNAEHNTWGVIMVPSGEGKTKNGERQGIKEEGRAVQLSVSSLGSKNIICWI